MSFSFCKEKPQLYNTETLTPNDHGFQSLQLHAKHFHPNSVKEAKEFPKIFSFPRTGIFLCPPTENEMC